MKPSLRLTTVAIVVLACLLLAAAVQIATRAGEIASYDRSHGAVQIVERLRDVNAAVNACDLSASPETLATQIGAVMLAIDGVTEVVNGRGTGHIVGRKWQQLRAGWAAARTGSDLRRLTQPTEGTLRDALLQVAAFALTRGSSNNVDGPLSEAALLALPALSAQEARLTAHFDAGTHLDDRHGKAESIALAERFARAQVISSVGFWALGSPDASNGLPPEVIAQGKAAQLASEAFVNGVQSGVEAGELPLHRASLAAKGHTATRRLDGLETTLLPLLDAHLARSRARAVREIVLTAFVVIAVMAIVAVLTLQALRSQSRSLLSREALEHQAQHDSLTGLPNRRAFAGAIAAVVFAWTPINDRTTWVLSIDLDYFKEVNDRYGHQTGDEFLIAAAKRLRDAAPDDFVARVGGDEFAVLVRHYDPDSTHALDVAQSVCEAFNEPIAIKGVRHRLAASVGIVAVDALHETVDSLLRDADIAMYRAKEDGGDRVVMFDDTLREEIVHRAELAAHLPGALRDGRDIGVVFQPIISLIDNSCYGFEALVRWKHPEHGPVDAALLIDVAQDARLIDELGRHIVHEVCRHLAAWRNAGLSLEPLSVHFNISPMEAVHADTFGSIAHALDQYQIPPRTLVVELTETASMDSVDAASMFLSMLHAIDVRICLDDFGTGYSSLRHLNDFHVDAIKIDRSFVVSAAEDPAKVPIIAGIIALAEGLNAAIIAEGIETQEQSTIVDALGCRLMQGYLFARPLTPDGALAFAQRALAVR